MAEQRSTFFGMRTHHLMIAIVAIAMLVGLPVSALVYIAACRSLDVVSDRGRCHAADAGLDPDAA